MWFNCFSLLRFAENISTQSLFSLFFRSLDSSLQPWCGNGKTIPCRGGDGFQIQAKNSKPKYSESPAFIISSPPELLDLVQAKPLPYFTRWERPWQILFVCEEKYWDPGQMRSRQQSIQLLPDIFQSSLILKQQSISLISNDFAFWRCWPDYQSRKWLQLFPWSDAATVSGLWVVLQDPKLYSFTIIHDETIILFAHFIVSPAVFNCYSFQVKPNCRNW